MRDGSDFTCCASVLSHKFITYFTRHSGQAGSFGWAHDMDSCRDPQFRKFKGREEGRGSGTQLPAAEAGKHGFHLGWRIVMVAAALQSVGKITSLRY